jgi:AcrR family transcriptional regulator
MGEVTAAAAPQGLRQRKKARTRAAIREQALRLLGDQGFDATTVEQIAAAAEVSPSTFFRYYPAKEDVLAGDGVDALAAEALAVQPPGLGPLAAVRAALASALASLTEADLARLADSAQLGMSLPGMSEFGGTVEALAGAVARRADGECDDFAARMLAGAVIGVVMAAVPRALEPGADLAAHFDAALAHLEAGLPLRAPASASGQ